MNKNQFINYISKTTNSTKIEAEKIINVFTNSITQALSSGEEVVLIGFGKFYTSKIKAREGRNPQTGDVIQIPEYTQPKFSAGKNLKQLCNK